MHWIHLFLSLLMKSDSPGSTRTWTSWDATWQRGTCLCSGKVTIAMRTGTKQGETREWSLLLTHLTDSREHQVTEATWPFFHPSSLFQSTVLPVPSSLTSFWEDFRGALFKLCCCGHWAWLWERGPCCCSLGQPDSVSDMLLVTPRLPVQLSLEEWDSKAKPSPSVRCMVFPAWTEIKDADWYLLLLWL